MIYALISGFFFWAPILAISNHIIGAIIGFLCLLAWMLIVYLWTKGEE